MSISSLVLVSADPHDLEFALKVSESSKIKLAASKSWKDLLNILSSSYSAYVFWLLSDEDLLKPSHPFFVGAVDQILSGSVDASRVFALTSKPIHHYQTLFERFPAIKAHFQHNIVRNYSPGSENIVSRLLDFAGSPEPTGLARLFDPSVKIQKLSLRNSSQKNTAVQALELTLQKMGFDARISSKIAQATDELLMNAIFDAARDKAGAPIRQMLSRQTNFALGANEPVDIEFALSNEYFGICVTDRYGSLRKETLFKFLHQNYEEKNYELRKYSAGAGLGLYGIVAGGLSLLASCAPNKRTDVALFFPRVKSYREFRNSFQFTAFF